jgi:hypothetical protein
MSQDGVIHIFYVTFLILIVIHTAKAFSSTHFVIFHLVLFYLALQYRFMFNSDTSHYTQEVL